MSSLETKFVEDGRAWLEWHFEAQVSLKNGRDGCVAEYRQRVEESVHGIDGMWHVPTLPESMDSVIIANRGACDSRS